MGLTWGEAEMVGGIECRPHAPRGAKSKKYLIVL